MESLSQFLKGEREKKGIRLEEIASITKIHLHALQLLEKGQWKQLPPEPFIRGFIVAYSKYVGLDSKDILERYRTEVGEKKGAAVLPATPMSQSSAKHVDVAQTIDSAFMFPLKKVAIGAGAVVGVLVLIVLISLGRDQDTGNPTVATSANKEVAAAPTTGTAEADRNVSSQKAEAKPEAKNDKAEVKAETKPEAKEANTEKAETKAEETAATSTEVVTGSEEFVHTLNIEGKDRTWVKIVIDEAPPIQYFLQAEGKAEYKAKNKIKLVLGNSTGTTIKHNGEVTEGRKLQGTIRSYIFPKDAKFPQDQPAKRDTATENPEKTEAAPDSEKVSND